MKKATKAKLGWFTFLAAILSFGAAYLLPQARNALVYVGVFLLIITSGLRPAQGNNKWDS